MKKSEDCRLELVSIRRIKRISGLQGGVSGKGVGKVRDFVKKRGFCSPVLLSDSDGCMTLIAGGATFEACTLEKEIKVPAVIVRTEGEADNLMFALQTAGLHEELDAVTVGAMLVLLIDTHGIPRKHIADTLGKSPAWINKMESLSRKLNREVQGLVTKGQLPPRSAQEIARLPGDVQLAFAVSAINDYLSKENITYLVNRYLNEDAAAPERDRIINTPKLALPNELKRSRTGRDNSDSARFSRAIARCLDDVSYLSNLLGNIAVGEMAVRMVDIMALADCLSSLRTRLLSVFSPGKNRDGCGGDTGD